MGEFDVIVVGGGLAGGAFALKLVREGARVALIERTALASPKVCGDFLSAEAQQLLAHLGLDIGSLGAVPIRSVRLVTGKLHATATLPFLGAGLSRLKLDEALLEKAAASGVRLFRGEAATALEPQGDGVCVRAGGKEFRGRFAGLATGKHNIRGWPRTNGTMTAYKLQFTPTPGAARDLDGVVQLAGYRGGYMGACAVEGGDATACWLVDQRLMRTLGPYWGAHLDYISRRVPDVGNLLAGARLINARPVAVSGIPYGYMRREQIAPNVYPLGDQLCVIPSLTGDGTSLALCSAIEAANTILRWGSAADYQQAFLHRVEKQFSHAATIDKVFKHGASRRVAVRAVSVMPWLARLAARWTRITGVSELTSPEPLNPVKAQAR